MKFYFIQNKNTKYDMKSCGSNIILILIQRINACISEIEQVYLMNIIIFSIYVRLK